MTLFKRLVMDCGLSIRGAAYYLGVSENTVKAWMSGRSAAPSGVLLELNNLFCFIEKNVLDKK